MGNWNNENHIVISLIIPLYNEGNHIYNSIKIINSYVEKTQLPYEIIVIDDGSSDDTCKIMQEAIKEIKEIRIIKLSRNFGKESALCAGLELCRGDACIVMDSDLQHPPSLIPQMINLWKNGYDVVECVKVSRGKENRINKLGAGIFYGLLKKFSGFELKNASDFKLLDKKVIYSWRNMPEKNTFFRGMSAWLGYKRVQIPFEVPSRVDGDSHWSIVSLSKLAISAITSFSSIPLHLITIMGNIFLISAIVLGINTLLFKILGESVDGFTTVILLLLIIGSILMISLGIIGEYIAKIYEESKSRPRYIIENIVDKNINETANNKSINEFIDNRKALYIENYRN